MLKRIALWTTATVFLAAAGIAAWLAWYSRADHSARLEAVREKLVRVEETPLADSSGCRRVSFALTAESGRTARGSLLLPAGAVGPLPALLVLGGHGTGARAAELIRLKKSVLLCAMDYPEYPRRKVDPLAAPFLVHEFQDSVLAAVGMAFNVLDYLASRPEADPRRITVVGASFGAPFAVIAAAFDPRVRGLALVHGAADLPELITWNLRKYIKNAALRQSAGFILGALASPFEPASYIGRVAPRPVLLVNSRRDERVPEACVKFLYEKAGQPKDLIWLDTGHIQPANRELIDEITGVVTKWLERKGLL